MGADNVLHQLFFRVDQCSYHRVYFKLPHEASVYGQLQLWRVSISTKTGHSSFAAAWWDILQPSTHLLLLQQDPTLISWTASM